MLIASRRKDGARRTSLTLVVEQPVQQRRYGRGEEQPKDAQDQQDGRRQGVVVEVVSNDLHRERTTRAGKCDFDARIVQMRSDDPD